MQKVKLLESESFCYKIINVPILSVHYRKLNRNILKIHQKKNGKVDESQVQNLVERNRTCKFKPREVENEAVKFSKEFVEVDKKTIAKVVDDFEKEHKKVVADVSHSVFEEMGGQDGKTRGRRDVPPKNYFPRDENLLKIFQNETNLQKKCIKCNTLLSSRVEVKNHIQMNHEEELKKAFSKEAMSLVPFHSSYLSWLQKDHIVNALSSRCCKDRNKVDL